MKSNTRALLALAAAVVLPVIAFLALQAAFVQQEHRSAIEADSLARARETNALIDGQLWADRSALEVLSSSQFIERHDWRGARERFAKVAAARPRWRDLILTDAASGRELFSTRRPEGQAAARPSVRAYLATGGLEPRIDGMEHQRPDCRCVAMHVPVHEGGRLAYVLTLELSTEDFQKILMAHAPAEGVSGVVDANGLFIARALDFRARLGTPASPSVRNAIRHASTGLFPSTTLEGMKSITAFDTSRLSGWSTHVAVPEGRLTGPSFTALAMSALAALVTLALAGLLAALAYRQYRAQRTEETRQFQSQKLEAIGQLAGGVAHDFNNLLMVIIANLDKLKTAPLDAAMKRRVEMSLKAADQGAALTRQLLSFARSEPFAVETVDLKALLEGLRPLLQQSLGVNRTLDIRLDEDARLVRSNGNQLGMAILNLVINARDAMPDGGVVSIASAERRAATPGVEIRVADTGVGMPRKVLDRAMEPFFTTKPDGHGTGLGLAQVFGIVRQSGGRVHIESQEGKGACVVLWLPAPPAAAAE